MQLFTIQVGSWRLAKALDIHFVDTTVKTGDSIFAPTWDMVMAYKDGTLSESDYTKLYIELLRSSYRDHKGDWIEILKLPKAAIACYCKAGDFCHRLLLRDALEKVAKANNLPFEYMGELTKTKAKELTNE